MKKLFKIIFVLLLLIILGVVVFILTFDLDRYRQPIVNEMSTALNRPVTVEKLNLKLSLVPTITVSGVKIGNPEEMKVKVPFAEIDSVDVTLSLIPLIKKEIQIDGINVGTANVLLIDENGKNNWTFTSEKTDNKANLPVASSAPKAQNDLLSKLRIDNISLEKLTLNYKKGEKTQQVVISNLVLKQLKVFSTVLSYNNQIINLSGNVNDLMDLVHKKKDYLFNIEAQAYEATAKISGSIGDVETLDNILLTTDIYTNNLRKTASLLGISGDKVPAGVLTVKSFVKGNLNELAIDRMDMALGSDLEASFKGTVKEITKTPVFSLKGNMDLKSVQLASKYGVKPMNIQLALSGTPEQITIPQLILTANKSDVTAQGTLSLKEKIPFLKGEIKSNYFDLEDIMADSSATSVSVSGANVPASVNRETSVFSDQKIDLGALKLVNAQLGLNFTHLKVMNDANNYYGASAQMQLLNGLMTINPLKIQMIGGTIAGMMQIDAKTNIPAFKAQLTGSNLALDKFKSVAENLKGSVANISLNLTATGQSPKAIVSHLNGQVEAELTEGKIVNKWFNDLPDVVGLFSKNKSFSYSKTDAESRLNCAALNLTVKNGIISMNKSVAIETSTINVVVSGQINLPQETLSISMLPSVNQFSDKTNNKLMLTQLIRVEGPFTSPKTRLDAKAAVDGLAQKGIEKGLDKLSQKLLGEKLSSKTSAEGDTNALTVGSLCQSALGHKLKGKVPETPIQSQNAPQQTNARVSAKQPAKEALSPKEQLKNQLMRSLTDVLKK